MPLLPNRSRNLSQLFRVLGRLGVARIDVRYDDRGVVESATVVTGSLQNTVSERDLPDLFAGSRILLDDAGGTTDAMDLAAAIVAASHSADGDDAGATVTLGIREHQITRTMPVAFVDPRVLLGTAG